MQPQSPMKKLEAKIEALEQKLDALIASQANPQPYIPPDNETVNKALERVETLLTTLIPKTLGGCSQQ